jgi:hypothetical protein
MSRRRKPADAALDDLAVFMRGKRDFAANVLWTEDAPAMWQSGYRTAIRDRVRELGMGSINLKQRLLISKVRPKFAAVRAA